MNVAPTWLSSSSAPILAAAGLLSVAGIIRGENAPAGSRRRRGRLKRPSPCLARRWASIPPSRRIGSAPVPCGRPFLAVGALACAAAAFALVKPAEVHGLRAVPRIASGAAALVARACDRGKMLAMLGFLLGRRIVPGLASPAALKRQAAAKPVVALA